MVSHSGISSPFGFPILEKFVQYASMILDNSGSSIGPNVSIGDNSVISVSSIENSIIMQNCKIDTVTEIKNSIIKSRH